MPDRQHPSRGSTLVVAAGGLVLVAVVAVAVYLVISGGSGTSTRISQTAAVTDARLVSVDAVEYDYNPRTLTVRKGATVTWNFTGKIPHTVTNDTGAFDSGVKGTGDSFNFRFDSTGEYYYYCTLHHVMEGTVTVTD